MANTIDIDLTGEGFPGSSVKLKDARYMRRKKFEALATEMTDNLANQNVGKGDEFLRSRIVSWDISYTDEDGEAVSLKDITSDDFGNLPPPLYVFLWSKLAESFTVTIPNALKSP